MKRQTALLNLIGGRRHWRSLAVLLVGTALGQMTCYADGSAEQNEKFFREKIEPVLKAECYRCHSAQADEVKGELRLDSRAAVLRGGESGPAIIAGKAKDSLLLQALRHEGGLVMPPQKPKLSAQIIADFAKWIEQGAYDPREGDEVADTNAALKTARQHWSFQPIKKAELPSVRDTNWPRTPIDAFILAPLEARSWQPATEASRTDLIRRVTFDLIGLPPTPAEVEAFIKDTRPDAYERVVDRLLNSERYGERWATHWLDVVRYAESEGYEYDRHIPDAWRYRDYVINALNDDKPFDRFLTEQLAGDELDADNQEYLSAAIFHRLGPVRRNAGNPDIALSRNEVLTERTDIIGAAFLGLTVGCARCHNHKLEPISQRDYYRLQAYVAAVEEHNVILAEAEQQRDWEARTKVIKDQMAALRTKAKEAEGKQKEQLEAQLDELEDQLPPPLATIPSIHNDQQKRTAIHVLRRGVWENKGEAVGPRPLSVLVADNLPELEAGTTDPRTQLTKWLASPDHPLTARVIVNRLWQQHFGTGLVKTVNDFGVKGERPSHPELLDWLSATLIENGWRLKPLHRLMVLSNVYRQSSEPHPVNQQLATRNQSPAVLDPDNRLLSHFQRRRLSAEELRDAMLLVSGRINLKTGGPSVLVPVDLELVGLLYKPTQWAVTADPREHDRRSVYLIAKRNLRLPFFENLDAPALLSSCGRRESSTHPPQALELLNGPLSNDLAASFARRLEDETGGDPRKLVDRAFRLALGRTPSAAEQARSIAFLREQPTREFALALFNLNAFLYVP